jgi:hypothetical protein
MLVTFQQQWTMELGPSLHCRLVSPVSRVASSPSCLFSLKISEADTFLRVAMAVKQIPLLRNKFGRFGDPSALKADATRYNYAVETIFPSVRLWRANDSSVRRIFIKFFLHKTSSNCESPKHQYSYNHTLITAVNKIFTLMSILLDRFSYNLIQNIFTSCRWINASLRNESSVTSLFCFRPSLHSPRIPYVFSVELEKVVYRKCPHNMECLAVSWKSALWKPYCTAGPKWIRVLTFCNYCPIWV